MTLPSSPPPYAEAFKKLPEQQVGGYSQNPPNYHIGHSVDVPLHHHQHQPQQQTVIIQQPGVCSRLRFESLRRFFLLIIQCECASAHTNLAHVENK